MTYRDVLTERALTELELEGRVPTSREDFLLGASAYFLKILAGLKYGDARTFDDVLAVGAANVVLKRPDSEKDKRRRNAKDARAFFEALREIAESQEKETVR